MTDRGFSQAIIDALSDDETRTLALIRLDFASGLVLAHNRLGEIVYNSETYIGLGNLGSISAVSEGSELRPYTLRLGITGIPANLLATALNDEYQGRDADIFLAMLDDQNQMIDGGPFIQIRYRMDYMEGQASESDGALSLTLQTRLSDWALPRIGRYTDQNQQSRFPGDLGLEFIAETSDKEINWGVPGGGTGMSFGGGPALPDAGGRSRLDTKNP